MEANYGETEIKELLQKVRIFKRDIGTYQIFAITENFDYAVKLSNGKILFKIEELQDDERDTLTPERLAAIANRFVSTSSPETNSEQKTEQIKSEVPQPAKMGINKTRIIAIIVLAVLVAGFVVVNNSNSSRSAIPDNYEEKVMTIEETERSQPTNFLLADGTYRENFWGNKIKVTCSITNKATVATYKDAVIKITYYSKTNTELGSTEHTIYEVFPPTSTRIVELKVDNLKNVSSIGWQVISAVPN